MLFIIVLSKYIVPKPQVDDVIYEQPLGLMPVQLKCNEFGIFSINSGQHVLPATPNSLRPIVWFLIFQ